MPIPSVALGTPLAVRRVVTENIMPENGAAPTPSGVARNGETRDVVAPRTISFIDGIARRDTPVPPPPPEKKLGFFQRIKNRLAQAAMSLALTRRMQRYDGGFRESFKAGKALFQVVEQPRDRSALQTVYPQTLAKMLQDPATDAFFTKLEGALSQGMADVWMIALKHFRTERATTAALAVLFQNVGGMGEHVMRILTDPSQSALHQAALRCGTICRQLGDPALNRSLLPPQLRSSPETRAERFLVAAEAAARLREQGLSPKAAALAPYAYHTANVLYPEGELAQSKWRALFPRDPKSVDRSNTAMLSDLYLGYAGAAFGAGYKEILPYASFESAYTVAPKSFSKLAFG